MLGNAGAEELGFKAGADYTWYALKEVGHQAE